MITDTKIFYTLQFVNTINEGYLKVHPNSNRRKIFLNVCLSEIRMALDVIVDSSKESDSIILLIFFPKFFEVTHFWRLRNI